MPDLPELPTGPMRTVALVTFAVAALVLLTAAYLASCRIWPYANCTRCNGAGKSRSPSRKAFRNCPRCQGTGRRERAGTKYLNRNNH
ncbi:hypothetical protein HPO96_17470 [Kribbella sandramycini]|uniref:Uncharacterized protein n=1 Tax=Kribbella sandramycini TaxID=60450 RepID=A0A7Y4L0H0_9ACTN|nr:hypothetical protein [Kribbella sandramycini]MBB6565776.1 hypothetical protein [Kribbella sandramycini]NOL42038.1 hypothetical protein [Kribbella sandramycini]